MKKKKEKDKQLKAERKTQQEANIRRKEREKEVQNQKQLAHGGKAGDESGSDLDRYQVEEEDDIDDAAYYKVFYAIFSVQVWILRALSSLCILDGSWASSIC